MGSTAGTALRAGTSRLTRIGALLSVTVIGGAIVVGGAYTLGFRINGTTSLPRGVYRADRGLAIADGVLVAGCLPERIERAGVSQGFVAPGPCAGGGLPLLKIVVGVAGERYKVTSAGVFVERKRVAGPPLRHDHRGRQLAGAGAGVIPPGAVFLVGEAAESWDSRYFGPVPMLRLTPMRAVWTEKPILTP